MGVQVGKATLDDSKALYAIHVASVGCRECRSMYTVEYLEAKLSSLNAEMYEIPILNGELLMALKGKTIVGFGRISVETENLCQLHWLFVHPTYFKTGVGTKLLYEMEKIARLAKCTSISVKSSLNAFTFYKKRGYRIQKTFADTILMMKMFN